MARAHEVVTGHEAVKQQSTELATNAQGKQDHHTVCTSFESAFPRGLDLRVYRKNAWIIDI